MADQGDAPDTDGFDAGSATAAGLGALSGMLNAYYQNKLAQSAFRVQQTMKDVREANAQAKFHLEQENLFQQQQDMKDDAAKAANELQMKSVKAQSDLEIMNIESGRAGQSATNTSNDLSRMTSKLEQVQLETLHRNERIISAKRTQLSMNKSDVMAGFAVPDAPPIDMFAINSYGAAIDGFLTYAKYKGEF